MADDDTKGPPAPFATAAEATGFQPRETTATPGLSASPGLRTLPDSRVPGLAGGGMISHVVGPQQCPADPIAAGLDTQHDPMTRNENRVVTQTGVLGAGPRPTTYAGRGEVPQAAPADGALLPVPADPEVKAPPGVEQSEMKPASEAIPHETEMAPGVEKQNEPVGETVKPEEAAPAV